MLRRAFIGLVLVFGALAFLAGSPDYRANDDHSIVSSTDTAHRSAPKGAIRDDASEFFQNHWVDKDHSPKPIDRPGVGVTWFSTTAVAALGRDGDIRPSHSACAARPRAPPAV